MIIPLNLSQSDIYKVSQSSYRVVMVINIKVIKINVL